MKRLSATTVLVVILGLCVGFSAKTYAQELETLPDHVPLLPEVKQKALVVDPQKEFRVKELEPDGYMITERGYKSVFGAR